MKQTIAQKIVARAAGRDSVEPGEYVDVTPDCTVCQEIAWPARKAVIDRSGATSLARPDKVVMVVDHTTSAGMGTAYYKTHREMRDFAEAHGAHFFGPGSGLRHQVLIENGFARPGTLVFSDEPNIASIGVVGALNIPMSSEVVVTQIFETNWMMVPRSVRFTLTGRLRDGVLARDLAQTIIRDFAETDTLTQSCIEYTGDGATSLSLDERQSILACSYHAGADTALMPVDALALEYARGRANGQPFEVFESDAGAEYAFEAHYDLSALSPMVTLPPELHNAVPVEDAAGVKVDQAAIGSCASGRLDDLRAAASLLRGHKIASHVTFYITPGSREIYAAAAREGLLEIFAEAGATVLAPGCTTCWGYEGFLNPGEVQISTHQMNYRGRNGSRESSSYLSSAYVVTASALAGRIADPRPMLAEMAA
ncbi:3-isopropylmalate dehydratase large subunit [Amorphus sp. MBR-141]